jgi:hypothetical protein
MTTLLCVFTFSRLHEDKTDLREIRGFASGGSSVFQYINSE